MKIPADVKYTKNDEWVRIEGDTATIGISDFAQDALNDIVYLELPDVGTAIEQGKAFGGDRAGESLRRGRVRQGGLRPVYADWWHRDRGEQAAG